MIKVNCPYCNREARFTTSLEVYGKDYGKIWLCVNYPKCDSYVGAHKESGKPKGTLADSETRKYRKWAHEHIDRLWKCKIMYRDDVYKSIQFHMNLTEDEAHIGLFNVEQCKELVRVFKENLLIK